MGAEAHQLQGRGIRLSVNQHEVGPGPGNPGDPASRRSARSRYLLGSRASAASSDDRPQIPIERPAIPTLSLALVVALKRTVRLIVRMQIGHQIIHVSDRHQVATACRLHGLDGLCIRHEGIERQCLIGPRPDQHHAEGVGDRQPGGA